MEPRKSTSGLSDHKSVWICFLLLCFIGWSAAESAADAGRIVLSVISGAPNSGDFSNLINQKLKYPGRKAAIVTSYSAATTRDGTIVQFYHA